MVIAGNESLIETDIIFRNTFAAQAVYSALDFLGVGEDVGSGEGGFLLAEVAGSVRSHSP